ncbi:SH3 domain-containing protein [Arhodomonas sp. AD133]|uniref:SH3 domain-containing protein n=1 Tax=Arhodomonas sp. AD133 TaxID=3415009 RepID=UPI003EBE0B13
MECVVIASYQSHYPHPIAFEPGDEVAVGWEDPHYPGWIWVRTSTGNQGWAPLSRLNRLNGSDVAVATRSYCARELDVAVGERVTLKETVCGWCQVVDSVGVSGWVPEGCLECV